MTAQLFDYNLLSLSLHYDAAIVTGYFWHVSVYIHVAPQDTLSQVLANQSLLFPLNAVWLAEKQHIPIL
jgi:hypothetical protein